MSPIRSNLLMALTGMLLILLSGSCEKNYPPKIFNKESARLPGLNSTSFMLRVDARDANYDELTYQWEASIGSFPEGNNQNETVWEGPQVNQDSRYWVYISVSDGKATIQDSIEIPIAAPTFGKLSGYAWFRSTKIPVREAVISIWGKSDTTDIEGFYEIDGIMAGRQTLYGSKEGFTSNSVDLKVYEGLNEKNIELTSTEHTTRLFGQLVGNMTGQPKPFLTVVILNPDFSESKLTAFSDATGQYELPYVPHGLRYITVRDEHSIQSETVMYFETAEKVFNVPIKEPFEFTDPRDNRSYRAVRISGQIWMMENLAYLPRVTPATESKGMWVYGYYGTDVEEAKESFFYQTYGVLYEWSTAVADSFGNGQDICPPGWRLPSDADFSTLETALGMSSEYRDSVGWRFNGTVGRKLKAADGWSEDGNGSNSSSFTALPAGNRTTGKAFVGQGGFATFWTSDELDKDYAWRRYLYWNMEAVGRFTDLKGNGYSVRCVKEN